MWLIITEAGQRDYLVLSIMCWDVCRPRHSCDDTDWWKTDCSADYMDVLQVAPWVSNWSSVCVPGWLMVNVQSDAEIFLMSKPSQHSFSYKRWAGNSTKLLCIRQIGRWADVQQQLWEMYYLSRVSRPTTKFTQKHSHNLSAQQLTWHWGQAHQGSIKANSRYISVESNHSE